MTQTTPRELCIGVAGHRPDRLGGADPTLLRQRVCAILTALGQGTGPGQVMLVSPLAAGADQLFAREALALSFRLVCPLPFPRDQYAADFAQGPARAQFDALLAHATQVVELDGSRATPESSDDAYAAVGRYVVDAADVLLAIWDGLEGRGIGGTADVINLAVDTGRPVLWISAQPPHAVRSLSRRPDGELAATPAGDPAALLNRTRHAG